MSNSSSPVLAGPSTPLNRLQLHSSIPSHLSTELSFLQTLFLRARDQHRTQLFLRRMHEVLIVGKLLLRYVKESQNDATIWEKRKIQGKQLVTRMIKALFTSQRFTAQILDLHHFVPLQTSVLAIYSRLFAITMNIASGLDMELENVFMNGGQRKAKRKLDKTRIGKATIQAAPVPMEGVMDTGKLYPVESMNVDGTELGEKIQRSSITTVSTSNDTTPKASRYPSLSHDNLNSQPQSTTPSSSDVHALALDLPTKAISRPPSPPSERDEDLYPPELDTYDAEIKKRKKKKKLLDIDAIFDSKARKEKISEVQQNFKENSEEALIPKKKKNKSRDQDGDVTIKNKKMKKKKDAMDDIFGF
ncbi:uncharacterized protein I206_100437 [Kwoniella pini CBS 10737]|uniref:Nucleolus and neural progenitor protein-like N-terminal domain-containing protein n=1 Tax=Kwoniella pini CBS 10737 TaxID=1296096 RepID=A0A1B9IDC3_9TREE|nr:uncharacterized protein I206_00890 [Kwoniella pini CBS 10737]OCF53585.1 hypothetical protein I206_00890 [Kwoniella pini CBS 10737]